MQEEVEQRTVTLAINTTKLTGRVLKSAISKFLAYQAHRKRAGPVRHYGKQTVKQLVRQDQGVSNIEVAQSGIRDFQRVARKYGVDYAIRKDTSGEIPKYLVFFKARDSDALTAAFQEYTNALEKKSRTKEKPSVLAKLRQLIAQAKADPAKARHKELER